MVAGVSGESVLDRLSLLAASSQAYCDQHHMLLLR